MVRIINTILCIVSLQAALSAQSETKVNVTFFGSSVCYGASAKDYHGYGWQLFHSGAIDTLVFQYQNSSTGGDNTFKVEQEDRLTKKLYPTNPNIVVLGLSLGNEGIRSPQDEHGREVILEQYSSRLLALADSLKSQGMQPVIVNCYAHSYFTDVHYFYTKRMNRIINSWKYPSINVLGTIDDLSGKWVEGYVGDPWHPNTAGHEEMSYAFVPSLFNAIQLEKKTPQHDWNKSYNTLKNEDNITRPLNFDVKSTMHSFTLSFKIKETSDGSIAGFSEGSNDYTIDLTGHLIQYQDLSTIYPKHLKTWTHIVLSHSYANGLTMFYVNGKLVGTIKEQLSPNQIHFGGSSVSTELKDLTIHRSALNSSEVADLYNNKFIQSSLEFYNPMTRAMDDNEVINEAQSLSKLNTSERVKLIYRPVDFYKRN